MHVYPFAYKYVHVCTNFMYNVYACIHVHAHLHIHMLMPSLLITFAISLAVTAVITLNVRAFRYAGGQHAAACNAM